MSRKPAQGQASVLVGREGVVERIVGRIEAGRPGAIVVEGEAGIGKTAVLRAVVARLPDGVVGGSGHRALDWQPYLPFRSILPSDLTALPEVTAAVRERARGRPIVVDDLHWADTATLACLDELSATNPVLAATRPNCRRCEDLRRAAEATGTLFVLAGLDDRSAERLVRAHHPGLGDVAVSAVVSHAHGNPLLLEVGPSPGDAGTDRITAEVARTSESACRSLARLALSGAPAAERDETAEMDELLSAGLIEVDRCGQVSPRHDLFGRAAVDLLTDEERCSLHTELAASAADEGARARHLLAAGDLAGARAAAAAAAATSATAEERAAHLLVSVQAAGDDVGDALLVETAEALRAAYRLDDALDVVARVKSTDPDLVLRAAAVDAVAAWTEGDYERAEVAILRGLAVTDAAPPGRAADAAVVDLLCIDARISGRVRWDGPRATASAEKALALAKRSGLPLAPVLSVVATAALVAGSERWRDALDEAIDRAALDEDVWTTFTASDTLFMAELMAGDTRRCISVADKGISKAEELGLRRPTVQMAKNLLLARFHIEGDLEAVVADARRLLDQPLHFRPREHLEATLAMASGDLGDFDTAEEVLHDAIGWQLDDPTSRAMVLWTRAEVDWLAGRLEAAYEAGGRCRQLAVTGFPAHVAVEPVRQWAALELGLDPGEPADTPLFPNLRAAALESEAVVALHARPADRANADRFLEAAESWAASLGRAAYRARWGAGEAARRAGDNERAIGILEPLVDELRATRRLPLLRRALATLRACGRRLPRPTPEPVAPFTGGEVEVLDLVGRGLASGDIARRLGVTIDTVDTVVRTARSRIGARTRAAAALHLARARSAATPAGPAGVAATVTDDDSVFDRLTAARAGGGECLHLDDLPETPWDLRARDLVAVGRVSTLAHRERAVLAALRGVHLVLHVGTLDTATRADLLDQLRRTDHVDVIDAVAVAHVGEEITVPDDVRRAASCLEQGMPLSQIADELNTSVRTLHRRLASARAVLDVETNVELLRRLGSG